ncbi:cation-translocating P-type ATPase [Halomicroarcula sp. F27]|uniref:Cation-translocating P-type ATPase n=1 Tax=Haloarcula nitratireducens TaxID=2487749 RepID=A0AAW4PH17_9EURY|nr:cation-translocating P-type ATPase [Halomicroarcula nitratireducens]
MASEQANADVGCALCGLPLSTNPVTNDSGDRFCCTGCREVQATIGDIDDVTAADVQAAVADDKNATHDGPPEGYDRTFLRVTGMHCTTCEAFLESVANVTAGVADTSASYVTETVRVDYDSNELSESALLDVFSQGAYTALHRDDDLARQRTEEELTWRLAAGVMFGMMVMLPYIISLYPVHFGVLYSGRSMELARELVASARYFYYFLFFFTSLVLFYTGGPLLRGAYVSLRMRQPNMDLLVSLAAVSAYLYSTIAVFLVQIGVIDAIYNHVYYDVTVAIILVVTAGTYYESTIKRQATKRLSELTTAQVDDARLLNDGGQTEQVAVTDLTGGDAILVREGERVPVDGTLRENSCTIDEAVVTGESLPVTKAPSDDVVGGTLVTSGAAVVSVDDGAPSSLDRIVDVLWDIQSATNGTQKLANKLAVVFVPLVLILAAVAGVSYLALGAPVTTALLVALTVLIVSCPCALGLATPLAVSSGIREAMEQGIVVFDDTVFERLRGMDVVVFDKTGTLTTGQMNVIETDAPTELLEMAAMVEERSSHPVAEAITDAVAPTSVVSSGDPSEDETTTHADGGVIKDTDEPEAQRDVTAFKSYTKGVQGTVGDRAVLVGHPALFDTQGWSVPSEIRTQATAATESGNLPVVIGRDGRAEGIVVVGDEPRDGWADTVAELNDRDIEVVVLTGDDSDAASTFRQHTHVDHVFAGVPPEGKAETVRQLGAGKQVTMVGDGTNDAPALASADLGIALGSGTALAVDAADIAIVDDDLASIATVFDIAAATNRRVKQNIGWAFLYNAIAIPLALAGALNPLFASVAMASSSLLVVMNSTRPLSSSNQTVSAAKPDR